MRTLTASLTDFQPAGPAVVSPLGHSAWVGALCVTAKEEEREEASRGPRRGGAPAGPGGADACLGHLALPSDCPSLGWVSRAHLLQLRAPCSGSSPLSPAVPSCTGGAQSPEGKEALGCGRS